MAINTGKTENKTAPNAAKEVSKNVTTGAKDISKAVTAGVKEAAKAVTAEAKEVTKDVTAGVKNIQQTAAAVTGPNARNELLKKVYALIPGKVSNETVVNALDMLRKEQKLLNQDFTAQLKKNEENFKKHAAAITKNKGYVEDQNSYTDMTYGEATMQYSGCEIFATYNAIFNITKKNAVSLSHMISAYEKDGMVFSGKFGTAPKAIAEYLNRQGFKTVMETEEAKFDALGKKAQSLILTMYNDKDDITKEVHTVNISKDGEKYTAHNVYCNGQVVGPYASVTEVIKHINNGKAKGISLIGINK